MSNTGTVVNKGGLAKILGVTERALTTWQKNGMPMLVNSGRGGSNSYNTKHVIDWMLQREVQRVAPGGSGATGILDRNTEDARLKKYQADKAEVDAQIAQRKVVFVEDVKDVLSQVAVTYGSQVDAIGGRVANDLAAITDPSEIRARIFEEGRRIRNQTADALAEFVDLPGEGFGEPGESPEPEDS